jgi:DNA polymerase-4
MSAIAAYHAQHGPDGLRPPGTAVRPPRTILHVDLDCFFVSVERVLDPSLSQRAVIVGGPADGRGVVSSASREARASGVHAGMPTAVARRLCPEAVFLPGRGRLYGRASAAAFRILHEHCPRLERASIDEAYLDATVLVGEVRSALDLAADVQSALERRLGLPSSVGIGQNKLISKVACQRAKPQGIVQVWPGYEEAFLAPLPVGDLPGIGPALASRLEMFGLRTARDVARVDRKILEATFGVAGLRLADRARGIGDETVEESETTKSISQERTFARDVWETSRLVEEVYALSTGVETRLRRARLSGRTVTLKLRTADFHTHVRSRTLAAATDAASEIAGVACFLLREAHDGTKPVRLVGVGVSHVGDQPVQESLFPAAPLPAAPRALPRALLPTRDPSPRA